MSDLDGLAEVVARLRRALRRGARGGQQDGLSVAQFELLQFVTENPGVRAGELAVALRLATTSVSSLLGPLFDAAVIERTADPDDRRAYRLHVTKSGQGQLNRWQAIHANLLGAAIAHLSAPDRRAIERALPALERLTEQLMTAPGQLDEAGPTRHGAR